MWRCRKYVCESRWTCRSAGSLSLAAATGWLAFARGRELSPARESSAIRAPNKRQAWTCAATALLAALVSPNYAANAAPGPDAVQTNGAAVEHAQRSLAGRVVDSDGQPIADAVVSLAIGGSERWAANTKSDSEGRFLLSFPEAWLAKGNFTPGWTVWACATGHQLGTQTAWKALFGGDPGEIVIALGPPTDTAFVVEDLQGVPVPEATVEPLNVRTQVAFDIPPNEILAHVRGVTDAAGRVKLPAVNRDGLFAVKVTSSPFGTQQLELDYKHAAPAERVIRLRPVCRLQVQIVADDPAHAQRALVAVESHVGKNLPPDSRSFTKGTAMGRTDERGQFVVPAIASGSFEILAIVDRDLPLRPRLPKTVEVRGGETAQIEIPLVPAVRVRGAVRVQPDGAPVAGALIHVGYGVHRQSESARTDAQGTFEAFVLPGPVRLQAIELPDDLTQVLPDDLTQLAQPTPKQHEVPTTNERFDLPPIEVVRTQEIQGRLVDQNDVPLVGAEIRANPGDDRFSFATTAEDGRFTMRVVRDVELTFVVGHGRSGRVETDIVDRTPLLLRLNPAKTPPRRETRKEEESKK